MAENPSGTPLDESRGAVPAALLVAAALAAMQGLALLGLAVAELASFNAERLEMGATTAIFFGVFGGVLMASAVGLVRLRSWGRGPVLFAQFVQLGLAWNLRDSDGWMVGLAVLMAVLAVVCLACMVQKSTIAALEDREIA